VEHLFWFALLGTLLLCGAAIWLWRRYYRDDQNAARRIVKNSVVPLAARLVVRALELVFVIVLYSVLDGADIGPYVLGSMLVAQFLGTISEFGLGVLLTREVARDPDAAPRLFGITLLMRWLLALAVVPVAALFIAGYDLLGWLEWGEPLTPIGKQVIWVLLLTLPPSAYAGAVTALYNAAERMEVPALIELITAMLSMVARIALLLLGFGILGLAWAAVAVTSITALIYLALQLRDFFPPTLRWDGTLVRQLFWLALPLMINNLLNGIFFYSDTFVIQAFGPGDGELLVTQYRIPYQILNIAMILPPVITFAVFPLLARRAAGERAALRLAQNHTLAVLLLLAFPIAMGTTLLAPDLIRFFTRDNAWQYLPISAQVLMLLAWFLPLSFVNGLLQYVLIAINRQQAITRAFVIGALGNVVGNILVVPQYGLYGASVTTILSELVLLAVFWPVLRQEGLIPPLLALAWRPALAMLGMGAAMWGALLLAGSLGWLAAGLVALPVYAGLLWLLGALGSEELALLRQVVTRTPDPEHTP
jgi:O-antigen/teichoic acid export membrane protein